MGYASLDQKGIGMHLRQFARAFIIDDATHRVVFVSIDSCMISDSVKREVSAFVFRTEQQMMTHASEILTNCCIRIFKFR